MHWVGEALVYLCVCLCVQWLVFRCGNTPGPFNEIPAVEESRVHVACGIIASLSLSLLSSTTSSPSSPSSIPLFSHHYSCTQPQYPCGLVSNAHFILSFSRFAPSCCYVQLTNSFMNHSFSSFPFTCPDLSFFLFIFSLSYPPGVSLFLFHPYTHTRTPSLPFPLFAALICHARYAGWSVMAVSIVTACMGPQCVCVSSPDIDALETKSLINVKPSQSIYPQ